MSKWTEITSALNKIEEAADHIEGFELDEAEQVEQIAIIKDAAREVRKIAHDILRPDRTS